MAVLSSQKVTAGPEKGSHAALGQGSRAALDRGELLRALRAFKQGDFSVRMPSGLGGIDGEIARAFNDVAAASAAHAAEEERLGEAVRRTAEQALYRGSAGDL